MIWVLNIDVAIGIMRSAFNPLSCAVEVYDYQKLIRLRVFDPDSKKTVEYSPNSSHSIRLCWSSRMDIYGDSTQT